jgi:hypothetical protein
MQVHDAPPPVRRRTGRTPQPAQVVPVDDGGPPRRPSRRAPGVPDIAPPMLLDDFDFFAPATEATPPHLVPLPPDAEPPAEDLPAEDPDHAWFSAPAVAEEEPPAAPTSWWSALAAAIAGFLSRR